MTVIHFRNCESGRILCKHCFKNIAKGDLVMVFYGPRQTNIKFHPKCFLEFVKDEWYATEKVGYRSPNGVKINAGELFEEVFGIRVVVADTTMNIVGPNMAKLPVTKEQVEKYYGEYRAYVSEKVMDALDRAVKVVDFDTFLIWKVLRERYY